MSENEKGPCYIIWFHVEKKACHQPQQPQPQNLPLLTPPPCTVGWFTKKNILFCLGEQIVYPKTQTISRPQKIARSLQKKFLPFIWQF